MRRASTGVRCRTPAATSRSTPTAMSRSTAGRRARSRRRSASSPERPKESSTARPKTGRPAQRRRNLDPPQRIDHRRWPRRGLRGDRCRLDVELGRRRFVHGARNGAIGGSAGYDRVETGGMVAERFEAGAYAAGYGSRVEAGVSHTSVTTPEGSYSEWDANGSLSVPGLGDIVGDTGELGAGGRTTGCAAGPRPVAQPGRRQWTDVDPRRGRSRVRTGAGRHADAGPRARRRRRRRVRSERSPPPTTSRRASTTCSAIWADRPDADQTTTDTERRTGSWAGSTS